MKNSYMIRKLNDLQAEVYDVVTDLSFYWYHLYEILQQLAPLKNGIYVDAGCGTGNLLRTTKEREKMLFIGVDFSRRMLKKAKKRAEYLILADLHYLPFKGNCVNGIVSSNVIYQLESPERFIEEAFRILKQRGRFVISTPMKGASDILFFVRLIMDLKLRISCSKKLMQYSRINKRIISLNLKLYTKSQLRRMMNKFKIIRGKKTYLGQNWLILAQKVNNT